MDDKLFPTTPFTDDVLDLFEHLLSQVQLAATDPDLLTHAQTLARAKEQLASVRED